MTARFLFALLLATTLFVGCKSAGEPPARTVPDDGAGDLVTATGTIRHVELEGGFYGIEADGGERYDPQNLADAFRQDGRRVRFTARLRRDIVTIRMWGTPVEIVEIEALEDDGP